MIRFAEGLVTPYHAFAILSGAAFAVALLWPGSAPDAFTAVVRGPFLPQAVAFLLGFLALQIGEEERGYGSYPLWRQVGRLVGLVAFGLALVLPFLLIHRVELGLPVIPFGGILLFLCVYGVFWALAGHGVGAAVHSDGLRFALKYGTLLLVVFLPGLAGLPVSPLVAVGGLWAGARVGWWGIVLYGALDLGAVGAWLWAEKGFSGR
ncbi:MAG: hypothetical protein Kow0097_02640 [Candidatus Bipolaricaulota bacterium]|nr:hypothetical protein [Candidatus Bipolaricaulota bacterium]